MRAALTSASLAAPASSPCAPLGALATPSASLRAACGPLTAPAARLCAALVVSLLAAPTAHADSPPTSTSTIQGSSAGIDSPLIAYAQELSASESPNHKAEYLATTSLRAANFEMARHPPPPDAECAGTLGAQRFAEAYSRLATIQHELGNFEAVIAASKSALACAPRAAIHEASIASAYLNLGQIAEARAAIERGNIMDPDDAEVRNTRARVDFIQEHWADAITRFRLEAVTRDKYSDYDYYAIYSRCYLWLAQRRAGMRNPELPPKLAPKKSGAGDANAETDPGHWPVPILETLRGERSEADLVQTIRDNTTGEARQWLTEALYYIGELKLANGDPESARRHFASVINLRVLNFVEYGMARAELARMREHEPVAEAATPGTGIPR